MNVVLVIIDSLSPDAIHASGGTFAGGVGREECDVARRASGGDLLEETGGKLPSYQPRQKAHFVEARLTYV